jgi:DNA-directed RNA polymerase specialized sigma24 family protein
MVRQANTKDFKRCTVEGLHDALNLLPQPYRGFLQKVWLEGQSLAAVARAEGLSVEDATAKFQRGCELITQASKLTPEDVQKIIQDGKKEASR